MDTKYKIKTLNEVQDETRSGKWLIVRGIFHLVTADLARTLAAHAGQSKLAVIVTSEGAFFDAAARAELLAALRCVSLVAIEEEPVEWPHTNVVEMTGDKDLQAFLDLVRQRQKATVSI